MTTTPVEQAQSALVEKEDAKAKDIKCVVWDLDNTVWKGVLLEGDDLELREGVRETLETLDERGILNSIASKNEFDPAMEQLKKFGLDEYFLYPQINWNPKSKSVKRIAESINIGIDTLAFIDDQEFEREEVAFGCPKVMILTDKDLGRMLEIKRLNPRFVTRDSKLRRKMYQADIQRNRIEQGFTGPQEEFLASLNMKMTIGIADEEDLARAEELTVRTNQLNATGYTYSYDELNFFRTSPDHILLMAGLEDKYGSYGKIGLTLLEKKRSEWNVKLLLMSCRVMSRGVGTVLINFVRQMAKDNGVRLRAEMIQNDRNRMMYMTYKFQGFQEVSQDGNYIVFENDLSDIPPTPDYLDLVAGVE